MDKLTIKMKNLFLAFLLFASTFASAQVTDAYMKQQADTIGRTTYTPTRAKHSIYNIVNSKVNVSTTVNGHPLSSNVTVTKSDLGLGNVDNTSDANKPAAGSNTQIQFNNSGLFGASPSLYYNNSTNVFNAAQTTTIVGSGTRTDNLYLGLNHTDSTVSGPNRWNMVVGEQHFVTNKSSSARKTINDSFLYGGYYNKIGISSTGGGGVAMSGVFGGHNNIVESFNNNIAFGNVVIGGWLNSIRPTSSVSADRVVGNFILAGSHNISDGYGSGTMGYWGQSSGYYSLVHGYVTTFTNGISFSGVPSANFDSNHEVQHTSTVPRILASGVHAVNISANSPSQTAGHGALGDYSVILGGMNSNIPSNAEASVVLGGHNMKMLSADSATVYVPRIRDRSGIGSGTRMVTVDATGHYSNQAIPSSGGSGTVTSVSVTTANGVSGSVATSTTTPAISLILGAITPTSVNGVALSGSSTPTLAVTGTTAVSGTNTGDQTAGNGLTNRSGTFDLGGPTNKKTYVTGRPRIILESIKPTHRNPTANISIITIDSTSVGFNDALINFKTSMKALPSDGFANVTTKSSEINFETDSYTHSMMDVDSITGYTNQTSISFSPGVMSLFEFNDDPANLIDFGISSFGNTISIGGNVNASGNYSFGIGRNVTAAGNNSFTGGIGTTSRMISTTGAGAFNWSTNDGSQTLSNGALAAQSAILGGIDLNIPSTATGSTITASNAGKVSASVTYTLHSDNLRINNLAYFGNFTTTPTARVTIAAGTTTVAPLGLTSGTDLTSPTAGKFEFNGTRLAFSPSTTRKRILLSNDAAPSNGQIPIGNGTDYTVVAITAGSQISVTNGSGSITIASTNLTGSATLDFSSISTLSSTELTITVSGAADGDVVAIGVPNASFTSGLVFTGRVSAANTVSIQCYNSTVGSIDPASGTFKVVIHK